MKSPESRVTKQLVEALTFENLAPYQLESHTRTGWSKMTFQVGRHCYQCIAKKSAFGRVRVQADSVARQGRRKDRCARWHELVNDIPMSQAIRVELIEELANTVHLCQWNLRELNVPRERRTMSYEELESAIDEGHPYHPCFKARTGFTTSDHAAYGPEAGARFPIHWLAVRRNALFIVLPESELLFWHREIGVGAFDELSRRLAVAKGDWQTSALLPAHPWQWNDISKKLATSTMPADIISLGQFGNEYTATQSVRTLICADNPKKAHVKLPLSTRVTSSMRDLQPEFLHSAPSVSQWLSHLHSNDSYLQRSQCRVLREYATAAHQGSADIPSGRLGVLFRESVSAVLDRTETAVPLNALMLVESDGLPFVHPWVSTYGIAPWVQRLVEVYVLPVWHLLAHHGVALEAHAQNCVLTHHAGWPSAVLLRDFSESLEYTDDFVAQPELIPPFATLHPSYADAPDDRYHRMSNVDALLELVMDCLFVFNLSDLSFLLHTYYRFSEGQFWRIVRAQLDAYSQSGVCSQVRVAQLSYTKPYVRAESLFTRRLKPPAHAGFQHWVSNPLA